MIDRARLSSQFASDRPGQFRFYRLFAGDLTCYIRHISVNSGDYGITRAAESIGSNTVGITVECQYFVSKINPPGDGA